MYPLGQILADIITPEMRANRLLYRLIFKTQRRQSTVAYLKNESTTGKTLVISGIGVNSVENSRIKLWYVTGTAAGGTSITPTNMNKASGNAATATAMEGASAATGITGLTTDSLIDFLYIQATGHEEFRLDDRLRLGQNDAIALEYFEGTTGDFSGVIFGYFE